MKARYFLFKHRHDEQEELELMFDILDLVVSRWEEITIASLAKVHRNGSNGRAWPDFDEDGVACDVDEEPTDSEMLEDGAFATEEDAYASAQEQLTRELATMIDAERQRLAESGRRRTNLTLTPFKESAVWALPDTPRPGMVPGAPVNGNGTRPPAGEKPMGTTSVLQTCDVCEFLQFRPSKRETTCPFCAIVIESDCVPRDQVKGTMRLIHKFLFAVGAKDDWNRKFKDICSEVKRKRRSVIDELLERLFPLWKKEFLTRIVRQSLPEETNPKDLVAPGWELWKELTDSGCNLQDETTWDLILRDLVEKEWARVTLTPENPPDEPREESPQESEPEPDPEPTPETQPPPPILVEEPVIEESPEVVVQPEVIEVPIPPQPPTPPVTPPVPEIPHPAPPAAPDPEPVSVPEEKVLAQAAPEVTYLGPPGEGRPLPTPIQQALELKEGVWVSQYVTNGFRVKLTTAERKQLIAIRRVRIIELANEHPDLNGTHIGSLFKREVLEWIQRIRTEGVQAPLTPSQTPRDVVSKLFDDLIKKIEAGASTNELVTEANQLREKILPLVKKS